MLAAQLCPTLRSPLGFSVHGILQARMETVAISLSGDCPHLGIKPRFPAFQEDFLPSESPGKLHSHKFLLLSLILITAILVGVKWYPIVFSCTMVKYVQNLPFLPLFSVYFSSIKYIHIVVQPLPLSPKLFVFPN